VSASPDIPRKVTLLGAGPTNLATALQLARNGVRVEVFEKAPAVGGMSGTFRHGDLRLDFGPHRFTPHTGEVHDTVRGLLGEKLHVVPQRVQVNLFGRFLDYPFRPLNLALRLPPLRSLRLALGLLPAAMRPAERTPARSYRDWVTRRFGRPIAENVFCAIAEKTWGIPADRLAASLAEHRIAISGVREIFRELLTGRRSSAFSSPFYPDNSFLYPAGGYGTISEAMASEIEARGGRVRTGAEVLSVTLEGDRVKRVRVRSGPAEEEVDCDYCVSTIPLPHLVRRIQPSISDAVVEGALERLRVRSLVLLYLVLRRERLTENHTIFFPGREFPFGRTFEQKNFDPGMLPAGRTVYGLEITCWHGDETWRAGDRELFDRCMEPLEKTGLLGRDEVEEVFTMRLPTVYPVVDLDFHENLAVVRERLDAVGNLIVNGRPGLLVYNNLHHAVEMGLVAARQILSGDAKRLRWEEDRKLFEEYRIVE
jgi:protoporphyrinogen oxidase